MAERYRSLCPKSAPTDIRHLYEYERPRKAWRGTELALVNVMRKLTDEEKIMVVSYAQSLALARIRARLAKRRKEARHAQG